VLVQQPEQEPDQRPGGEMCFHKNGQVTV